MGSVFGIVDKKKQGNFLPVLKLEKKYSTNISKVECGQLLFGYVSHNSSCNDLFIINNGDTIFFQFGKIYNTPLAKKDILTNKSQRNFLDLDNSEISTFLNELIGDWSLFISDRLSGKLVLARDHCGNSTINYFEDSNYFIFSSSMALLLDLLDRKPIINEIYLFNRILNIPLDESYTIYRDIRRVSPGHYLSLDSGEAKVFSYWNYSVFLKNDFSSTNSVEDFSDLFTKAVSERMPEKGRVGSHLSSGLDSNLVVSVASALLKKKQQLLHTYTSIPFYSNNCVDLGAKLWSEEALARSSAQGYKNISSNFINSGDTNLVETFYYSLQVLGEPVFASANLYWIIDILKLAAYHNIEMLFTGATGNATVSYKVPEIYYLKKYHYLEYIKRRVQLECKKVVLRSRYIDNLRTKKKALCNSPMTVGFINKMSHFASASKFLIPDTIGKINEHKLQFLQLGNKANGYISRQFCDRYGFQISDPTGDKRLIESFLQLPAGVLFSKDMDRLLVKKMGVGTIPNNIIYNTDRGMQSSDIISRIERESDEIKLLLQKFRENDQVSFYLDIDRMESVFTSLKSSAISKHKIKTSKAILLRGILFGIFLKSL